GVGGKKAAARDGLAAVPVAGEPGLAADLADRREAPQGVADADAGDPFGVGGLGGWALVAEVGCAAIHGDGFQWTAEGVELRPAELASPAGRGARGCVRHAGLCGAAEAVEDGLDGVAIQAVLGARKDGAA